MRTYLDLTDVFPVKFDTEKMLKDIATLEKSGWLSHYDAGLSANYGAIPLIAVDGRIDGPDAQRPVPMDEYHRYKPTKYVDHLPYFAEVLKSFKAPKGRTRIMKLAPGATIAEHRDIDNEIACLAFNHVRLHIPIVTNPGVFFFVGGERLHMKAGHLYYVNFSKKHHVRNDGNADRIHLVMDMQVNDWFRQFLPQLSPWEKFEYFVARTTWPSFWKILQARNNLQSWAWRTYIGSPAQKLVHFVKGKKPKPVPKLV